MLRLAVASTADSVKDTGVVDRAVIGARARGRRIALNLTQADLAQKAGVAPNTVGGFETGKRETQGPKAEAIAQALGTTLDMLMRPDEPVTEGHPLLVGLNDSDLQIAQAYSRARTKVRLRVERLLLEGGQDAGLDLLERIENLKEAVHKQTIANWVTNFEKQERGE